MKEIEEYVKFVNNTKVSPGSYKSFWDWPMYKLGLGIGAGYLIMRELPVRSFYARSFIMGVYLLSFKTYIWYHGQGRGFRSDIMTMHNPEHWFYKKETVRDLQLDSRP